MASELISSIILAIVQGITEWFPVSSDGHLVLFSNFLGVESSLEFDVALHFGTLMAVFVYFGQDIVNIIRDLVTGKWKSPDGKLGLYIIVATIPAVIVGFLFKQYFEIAFGSLGITALGFAVTGVFLLVASVPYPAQLATTREIINKNSRRVIARPLQTKNKDIEKANFEENGFGAWKAFLIGVAQVFALFPGVSRSAATIGTGLMTGLDEKSAMKFSFLMSIPVIFGANILVIGNKTLPSTLILPTLVSFVVGLFAIYLLYDKILNSRKNLRWFGIYTLALAIGLGIWILLS